MLTANDKQTTTPSILSEVNFAKKNTKKLEKIYFIGIVPQGNHFQLALFPSLGIVSHSLPRYAQTIQNSKH